MIRLVTEIKQLKRGIDYIVEDVNNIQKKTLIKWKQLISKTVGHKNAYL